MAMTNTERQKKYREKQRIHRRTRKDIWADPSGFIAPKTANGGTPSMTKKAFDQQLKKILANYSESAQEFFLAELFEYTKRVDKICSPIYREETTNVTGNK